MIHLESDPALLVFSLHAPSASCALLEEERGAVAIFITKERMDVP
ncbi:hypothetical protein GGE16_000119 [Rhizobium leguminosarum]|uniref:Uncharacterized protein n=1 Tax=Rhizobium leguminosarum TaxID=384 RepID=A0AAE2SUT3_RHILE|nr:hypothetical protein [Rhizobium leguminosarum]MBB4432063.1 hypothetical protein [Rhizobium esperanzae]MBB4295806.1 hypothetical protein [Rhizobium leguminosarum]MBB4307198.1 hypothetical protein [Rhizobium leguminosarum]MBB4417219.1 hypothetical protein [Rhizobium leguminosarum]